MDSLPQELVDRIASFLDRKDLGAMVLLSRNLQYATEYHSGAFAEARLKADSGVIRKFLSVYGGHRSSYLRTVVLETSISGIHDRDWTDKGGTDNDGTDEDGTYIYPEQDCRDPEKDVQTINEAFSRGMSMMFNAVSALEKHTDGLGKIHLVISIIPTCGSECLHKKRTSLRVRLLSPPSKLPQLSGVCSLEVTVEKSTSHSQPWKIFDCHVEYRAIFDIARRCPRLDTLKCRLGGNEWIGNFSSQTLNESCQYWAGLRRDSRHGLEDAVRDIHKTELFHNIGSKENSGQMGEHWNDIEDEEDGLDHRDIFTDWEYYPRSTNKFLDVPGHDPY